jgi:two-component system response regulator AtoC
MLELDRLVSRVATTSSTVLVTGESGTGKGVIARSLHEQSLRCDAPFIPVNCGAIPENLIESELFGHTKGAFTGAERARKGLFSQADRGTIFLDEIGEMPLHMQAKILHVLEDKVVRPLGGDLTRPIDVRIVAATNRDLLEMVKQGKFREDLYFRLSKFVIHVPPLRERKQDIPRLIQYMMQKIVGPAKPDFQIDPVAEDLLTEYPWPGNVRELDNVLNRACILADGGRITISDIPTNLSKSVGDQSEGSSLQDAGGSLRQQMNMLESQVIFRTIDECKGDRRLAAARLQIGLSSLYRKMEEFSSLGLNSSQTKSTTWET